MMGVPSRLKPFFWPMDLNIGPQTGSVVLGGCVNQKYVMIHIPSKSSQKYPNGALTTLPVWVPVGSLLSLPSMALRLVANLQSWLKFVVNTVCTVFTGKHGVDGARGLCMSAAQGFMANWPFGSVCFRAA